MIGRQIRLAARATWRRPAAPAATVLCVGIALAGNLALGTAVDRALFREPPYLRSHEIVHLSFKSPLDPTHESALMSSSDRATTTARLTDRAQVKLGGAFQPGSEADVDWGLRPAAVTPSLFKLLGISPRIGTVFVEESASQIPRPIILSDEIWRRRFSRDPKIIDRTITIPGSVPSVPWQVVGVMPEGFDFPGRANVWIPYDGRMQLGLPLPTYARLAPGESIDSVQQLLPGVQVQSLKEALRPEDAAGFLYFEIGAALLLLLAWIHGVFFVFSSVAARRREVGLRLALGGTYRHILSGFVAEVALILAAALMLALVLAQPVSAAIGRLLPAELSKYVISTPGWRTVLLCSGLVLSAGALSFMYLARMVRKSSPLSVTQHDGRARLHPSGFLAWALFLQAGATTVLLYLMILFHNGFLSVTRLNLGFEPRDLVAMSIPFPVSVPGMSREARRAEEIRNASVARETLDSLNRLPAVEGAAFAMRMPLGVSQDPITVRLAGASQPAYTAFRMGISSDYLRVVGGRLVSGREAQPSELTRSDVFGVIKSKALVNETLAAQLGGSHAVVGSVLEVTNALSYEIVGVIADIRHAGPSAQVVPMIYWYFLPDSYGPVLLVRMRPGQPRTELRTKMSQLWGERAPRNMTEVTALIDEVNRLPRARRDVFGAAAALSLPIAVLGIAGAVGHLMERKRHDVAIQFVLGATRYRALRYVAHQVLGPAAAGIAAGLSIALWVANVIGAQLHGIRPLSAEAAIGTVFALAMVAVAGAAPTFTRLGWLQSNLARASRRD